MKTKWLSIMLVAAALFALSASAGAAEVAIDNAGFESPAVGEGGYTVGNVDFWDAVGGPNGRGVWNPGVGWPGYPKDASDQIPEGQQVGYVQASNGYPAGMKQVLAETLTADTTYTLSVQVGNNWYYNSGDYVIELRAGGTVLADFGENAETNITDDTFELRTVTYTYDPLDAALLGRPLEIQLYLETDGEVDFDDVKLDASVCFYLDHSPADWATVQPASDLLLSWTNRDPNYPGDPVYVDVWFGTDPNHPSANYTKVVDAGENTTSVPVDASVDGTYYWQVNSYLYGSPTGDPCEGCVFTFNVVSDLPPTVDAGVDMITWSGEPVPLDPNVVDDGVSDLSYLWTADHAFGVSFDPNEFIEDPAVTIDKSGNLLNLVANAGFEKPSLNDGGWVSALNVDGWVEGYYDTGGSGDWVLEPWGAGAINPSAAGSGYEAPEGQNVGFVTTYPTTQEGLRQELLWTLQADTTYTLSAKVGNPKVYNEGATADYRIELLAGDIVVASTTGASPLPAPYGTDPNWFDVSLTHNSGAAGTDPNVGQPMEIRLVALEYSNGWEVHFDDVKLTADPDQSFPAVHTVTLTLAVNDVTNPTPVKDTMTIDVYDNACLAARIGLGLADITDLDDNCITDLKDLAAMLAEWLAGSDLEDFAELAAKWLVDYALTAPVARP